VLHDCASLCRLVELLPGRCGAALEDAAHSEYGEGDADDAQPLPQPPPAAAARISAETLLLWFGTKICNDLWKWKSFRLKVNEMGEKFKKICMDFLLR
jgi:hypothetical protein